MQPDYNLAGWLAGAALRPLVVAAFAAALMALFRVKDAAARHAAWTVVMAGMLATAALTPLLPPLRVPILPASRAAALPDPALPAAFPALPAAPLSPAPVPESPPAARVDIVAVVYGAVVLVFFLRLSFGYLFTRRLVRAARRIHQPWATEAYESTWISVPLTVGWLRPKILLPAGWEAWPREKLDAVLAHEFTHVRRADWAIGLLAGLNRCVFWFHPLAWWLERRLASLAEQACDDAALLLVGPEPYAQALLDMASAVKTGQGRLVWEAMAMAKASEVRKRIELILDETRQIPKGLTRLGAAALLACGVPLVYLATVITPVAAQQPQTPAAMSEYLKGKRQLTQADATVMEQYLAANPQDLDVRTQLVLYYYLHNLREPRLGHIYWLIANHPESNAAVMASEGITPGTTSLNDATDYARAAGLWKQQAAARAHDPGVLANAARFFSQPGGDLQEAERLLVAARALDPGNASWSSRLGKVYAAAILGSTGDPAYAPVDFGFAQRVRTQLETSDDRFVVVQTGLTLVDVARRPRPGETLPPGVLNLDEHPLLVQAMEFGQRLLGVEGGIPSGVWRLMAPKKLDRPGGVQGGVADAAPSSNYQVTQRVEPVYPPLARQARISGVVRLSVKVGPDGHVTQLIAVSGHPLLAPAALEAVRQWVFSPSSAGTIQVDVPFDAGSAGPTGGVTGGVSGGVPGGVPGVVVGGVPAPSSNYQIASRVDPVYPPLARQARISGIVRLSVSIGPDGHVTGVTATTGHPLLAPAAIEAVKQWTFSPAVAGTTQVTVPFSYDGTGWPAQAAQSVSAGSTVSGRSPLTRVDPVYPAAAREARIEGNVTLQVTIGEDGIPEKIQPLDGNPLLVAAAIEAVRQWVYAPIVMPDGTRARITTTVVVPFRLNP